MKSQLIFLLQKVASYLEKERRLRRWVIEDKGVEGLTTSIDKKAEEMIVSSLKEIDPSMGIWAEERGQEISWENINKGDKYWLIDPLDGTSNYINGLPIYSISLALCKGEEVQEGIVFYPVSGEYCYARKGFGAFYFNGKEEVALKLKVNKKVKDCLFSPGRLRAKRRPIGIEESLLDSLQGECRAIRRLGSAAWEICLVAIGALDGFWQYGLKPWDIGAGILIAREAGFLVKDYHLKEATHFSKSLLILPPKIVEKKKLD